MKPNIPSSPTPAQSHTMKADATLGACLISIKQAIEVSECHIEQERLREIRYQLKEIGKKMMTITGVRHV